MQEIHYVGNELELFQNATVWKNYFGSFLKPYLHGKVLEVGAGIGGTTHYLCDGTQQKWVCLEPDPKLYEELHKKIQSGQLPSCCTSVKGITRELSPHEKYDAIMYIDVIEHIEKDDNELEFSKTLLAPGGHLIVLVPAHQFLFSPFDRAIGHYRRYNKRLLKNTAPKDLGLVEIKYLDSFGLLASLVNKYFLKQKYPTLKQIQFWDKTMVRLSYFTDKISAYKIGKTVVGIWKKL